MSLSILPVDASNNDALVSRLFDLSDAADADSAELTQLDALVYGRMAEHYGLPLIEAEARIAA